MSGKQCVNKPLSTQLPADGIARRHGDATTHTLAATTHAEERFGAGAPGGLGLRVGETKTVRREKQKVKATDQVCERVLGNTALRGPGNTLLTNGVRAFWSVLAFPFNFIIEF